MHKRRKNAKSERFALGSSVNFWLYPLVFSTTTTKTTTIRKMGDFGQDDIHFDQHGILWYGGNAYVRVPDAAAEIMLKARNGPVQISMDEAEAMFTGRASTTATSLSAITATTPIPPPVQVMRTKIAGIIEEITCTPKKIEPNPSAAVVSW
jgi:hypothetical protein